MSSSGVDSSFIDKLKSKVNIVDIISRYVPIQKRGKSILACCPFHMEKTPSFNINEEEQYYHCFGCGDGGDVIKFVRKFENVDFIKAVEIIAKYAGIEMPEVVYNKEIADLKKRKDKALEVNKVAAKHYNENLFSVSGANAYKYLTDRGLSRKTIIKFGLGFSKDYYEIVNFLKSKGYHEKELLDSGVCQGGNGKIYDAYSERITFPIIDTYDQVVGFSARTMKKETNIAKYKNTAANLTFDKSRILYGLNNVKKLKQTEGLTEILVLEGQMDVIKLYEAGIKNCVACLGTALTKEHASMLKRFSEKIILSLDGDSAGQKASFKSIDVLQSQNLDVRVVKIPNKMDPDEFVSKYGCDEFLKLVSSAKTGTQYKLESLAENFNLKDKFEKSKYIKQALEVLKGLNDIDKEIYLESLSKISSMPIDILRRNLKADNVESNKTEQKENDFQQNSVNNAFVMARRFVLASLLNKRPYAYNPEDEYFDLVDADLIKLFNLIKQGKKIGDLYSYFNEEESPEVFEIIGYNFNFPDEESEAKFYDGSVKQIKLRVLEKKKDTLNDKIKQCLDEEERKNLINEMGNVLKQINKYKTEEN